MQLLISLFILLFCSHTVIAEQSNNKIEGSIDNTLYHLQSQPDNYYTLQLLGSSSYKAIQKVLQKHDRYKELFWFKNKRAGKDWFTLLYGSYVTKEQALHSYHKLPKSLKIVAPWVRSIKILKKQLINNFDRQDVNDVMQMLDN